MQNSPLEKLYFQNFFKKFNFQIIIGNLKVSDYKEKCKNVYNPKTLSCKKKPATYTQCLNEYIAKNISELFLKLEQKKLTLIEKLFEKSIESKNFSVEKTADEKVF